MQMGCGGCSEKRTENCEALQIWMAAAGIQTTVQGYLYLASLGHGDEQFQLFLGGAE